MECLDVLLGQEETYWHQQSRSLWLSQGDRNTRFFHKRAKNRKSKNLIKGLYGSNGNWISDEKGIESSILNYFEDLFKAGPTGGGEEVLQTIDRRVTSEMNLRLDLHVSAEEVRDAIFNMQPSTVLGLDGMSPFFF
ncbi:hypothetical protein COP1_036952 [Malus domestica]